MITTDLNRNKPVLVRAHAKDTQEEKALKVFVFESKLYFNFCFEL